MSAALWLKIISAAQILIPIIARAAYPFLRPRLAQLIRDPNTTHDEAFMDAVDSAVSGRVRPNHRNEPSAEYRERDERAKLKK